MKRIFWTLCLLLPCIFLVVAFMLLNNPAAESRLLSSQEMSQTVGGIHRCFKCVASDPAHYSGSLNCPTGSACEDDSECDPSGALTYYRDQGWMCQFTTSYSSYYGGCSYPPFPPPYDYDYKTTRCRCGVNDMCETYTTTYGSGYTGCTGSGSYDTCTTS